MSDTTLPLMGQSGISPVMMTGEVVMNARKDMTEYESRQGSFGAGGLIHISHIAQGDMCFIRKGKNPTRIVGFGDNEFAIDCWAGFDGIAHEEEDSFRFVGFARNQPMHQNMQGRETMEAGFALQIGGSRTILCRSRTVIPIGSLLVWKIPRDDGLPADTSKHGRVLAEIAAYKPSDALTQPHMIHRMVKDVLSNKVDLSILHASDRAQHQNALKIFEGFKALAFSSVVVYLKSKSPNGVLSDAAAMDVAESFNLVRVDDNVANKDDVVDKNAETTLDLLDTLLQVETHGPTGNSVPSPNKLTFPLTIDGNFNANRKQKAVSQMQAAQFLSVMDTMLNMFGMQYSRVFAWTLNGGHPGGDTDVVAKRI